MRSVRIALALITPADCFTPVMSMRTGLPHPAGPRDCSLGIVSISAADMMPGARFGGGDGYENVGTVSVNTRPGADPMSDETRSLVRPEACAMGGEVVSLLATGGIAGGGPMGMAPQNVTFTAWAKASATAVQPQKF